MTQLSSIPNSSAVVVIDMANDFVFSGGVIADAGGPTYQARAQAIIAPLARLLAAARDAGVTVVYATDAHTPADSELQKWPPHAMAGSWNAEIVAGLAPRPGDVVIPKPDSYSPFFNPAFAPRRFATAGSRSSLSRGSTPIAAPVTPRATRFKTATTSYG